MNTATTSDGGIDRVPEHVPEYPDPDDLINQPAQARTEEEKVDQRLSPCYFHAACNGLADAANAGFAPGRGRYFCARPLSTSAT